MGTQLKCRTFAAMDLSKLREVVDEKTRQDAYEDGHCYSGSWGSAGGGLVVSREVFSDADEAEEWLSDNCEKRGPLIAVKLLQTAPKKAGAAHSAIVSATERLVKLEAEAGLPTYGAVRDIISVQQQALMRAKNGKSEHRACPTCKSRIAVSYLRHHACPVCADKAFLLTNGDKSKLDRLTVKVREMKAKIDQLKSRRDEESRKAAKHNQGWVWMVGANCPE